MRFSLAFLALSLFVSAPTWAKTVFVQPIQPRGGVSADEAATLTDLVRMAVERQNGFSTVSDENAEVQVSGQVVKLGQSYIVSLRKKEAGQSDVAQEMKVKTFDEMDTVTQRLVGQALTGRGRAPEIGEVTSQEEVGNNRRIEAVRQWSFGFGPAWTQGLKDAKPASVWSLGYSWFLETDFELLLRAEYMAGKSGFSTLTLGGGYSPWRTRHAPFVMAELGYGLATVASDCEGRCLLDILDRERTSGWVLGAGLGYRFFRTSNVNVSLVGRYDFMVERTSLGHPSKSSLNVVVSF